MEDTWPPPFVHALCAAAVLPRFLMVPATTVFTQFAPMFDVPLEMRCARARPCAGPCAVLHLCVALLCVVLLCVVLLCAVLLCVVLLCGAFVCDTVCVVLCVWRCLPGVVSGLGVEASVRDGCWYAFRVGVWLSGVRVGVFPKAAIRMSGVGSLVHTREPRPNPLCRGAGSTSRMLTRWKAVPRQRRPVLVWSPVPRLPVLRNHWHPMAPHR